MTPYDGAKLIEIVDPQSQEIRETPITGHESDPDRPLFESLGRKSRRPLTLREAAENNTSRFPTILRDGLRAILFDSYAGVPQTWQLWADSTTSDRMEEDWVEESGVGMLPAVGENDPYPLITRNLDRTVQIRNQKYGGIIKVTEEMIFFNRLNILRQQPQMLGRALATTKEQLAYNIITTTGNYTRNSTTGDNDIGANTATTTFNASGLELAFSTLRTMKDRHSGIYLGVAPDTLIVGPRLEVAAKQLLLSPELGRGGATNEVYGTGTVNHWRGMVRQIIVAPQVQSYAWVLMESKRAVVHQSVWPVQLIQSGMTADNPEYLHFDSISYRGREFYGIGMLNDRYAFYSDSTTAPTVT